MSREPNNHRGVPYPRAWEDWEPFERIAWVVGVNNALDMAEMRHADEMRNRLFGTY